MVDSFGNIPGQKMNKEKSEALWLVILLSIADGQADEKYCKIIQNSKNVSVDEGGTIGMKYMVDLSSPFQWNWTLEIDVYQLGHDGPSSERMVLQSYGEAETLRQGRSLVIIKEVGCSALSLTFKQEDCRRNYSGTFRTEVRVNEEQKEHRTDQVNDKQTTTPKVLKKQCKTETVLNVKEGSRSSQATTNEIRCVPKEEHVPTRPTLVSESLEGAIIPTVSTHRRFIETTKPSKKRFTDGKTSTSDGFLSVSTVNPYEGVMRRNNNVAETGVSSTLILVFALAVFSGILLIGLVLMAVMYSNRPRNRQTSEHIVRFTAGRPAPVDV
ncbi:uncharacterized protein [Ptychodera flava]|uniref:uncharacterized protein n=1 Tax=Ptychodera flava TaxID=63121 RepID=UPI00396A048C